MGSSESEAETQTVGKSVESSEAITETNPQETTTETPLFKVSNFAGS